MSKNKDLIVYMAHNKMNGKCYFGSTFQTLEKRKKQHIAKSIREKATRNKFYQDLKANTDHFFWIELLKVKNATDRSPEEIYLKLYHKEPWCYNIKDTAQGFAIGELNPNHTQKWKEMMKEKLSGKNNPIHNHSHKITGSGNGMYGRASWDNPNKSQESIEIWRNAKCIYMLYYCLGFNKGYKSLAKAYNSLYKKSYKVTGFASIYKKMKKEKWSPYLDKEWIEFFDKDIV